MADSDLDDEAKTVPSPRTVNRFAAAGAAHANTLHREARAAGVRSGAGGMFRVALRVTCNAGFRGPDGVAALSGLRLPECVIDGVRSSFSLLITSLYSQSGLHRKGPLTLKKDEGTPIPLQRLVCLATCEPYAIRLALIDILMNSENTSGLPVSPLLELIAHYAWPQWLPFPRRPPSPHSGATLIPCDDGARGPLVHPFGGVVRCGPVACVPPVTCEPTHFSGVFRGLLNVHIQSPDGVTRRNDFLFILSRNSSTGRSNPSYVKHGAPFHIWFEFVFPSFDAFLSVHNYLELHPPQWVRYGSAGSANAPDANDRKITSARPVVDNAWVSRWIPLPQSGIAATGSELIRAVPQYSAIPWTPAVPALSKADRDAIIAAAAAAEAAGAPAATTKRKNEDMNVSQSPTKKLKEVAASSSSSSVAAAAAAAGAAAGTVKAVVASTSSAASSSLSSSSSSAGSAFTGTHFPYRPTDPPLFTRPIGPVVPLNASLSDPLPPPLAPSVPGMYQLPSGPVHPPTPPAPVAVSADVYRGDMHARQILQAAAEVVLDASTSVAMKLEARDTLQAMINAINAQLPPVALLPAGQAEAVARGFKPLVPPTAPAAGADYVRGLQSGLASSAGASESAIGTADPLPAWLHLSPHTKPNTPLPPLFVELPATAARPPAAEAKAEAKAESKMASTFTPMSDAAPAPIS